MQHVHVASSSPHSAMSNVWLSKAACPRCRCCIDTKPRKFDAESANLLCNFAEMVVREIEKEKARVRDPRLSLTKYSTPGGNGHVRCASSAASNYKSITFLVGSCCSAAC